MTIVINNLIEVSKFIIITLLSVTSSLDFNKENINLYNLDSIKTSYTSKIEKFNYIEKEVYSIPYGQIKVISEGTDGIYYYINNEKVNIQNKIDEVVEVGMNKKGNYTGILTAYGPDCIGCSVVGNVACSTRSGKNHSLINDGIYYNDIEYKNLRILAADHREFPCGTIIEFNNNFFGEPILGIVLDTGFAMRKAYNNNTIHFDLAFESEKNINNQFATNTNTLFKVKRWGW